MPIPTQPTNPAGGQLSDGHVHYGRPEGHNSSDMYAATAGENLHARDLYYLSENKEFLKDVADQYGKDFNRNKGTASYTKAAKEVLTRKAAHYEHILGAHAHKELEEQNKNVNDELQKKKPHFLQLDVLQRDKTEQYIDEAQTNPGFLINGAEHYLSQNPAWSEQVLSRAVEEHEAHKAKKAGLTP